MAIGTRPLAVPLASGIDGLCTAHRLNALEVQSSELTLRSYAKALGYAAFSAWWNGLAPALQDQLLFAVKDPILAPAMACIEADLAVPLYNRSLADACALSTSAFVRRFRAATGMSPAQFVLERRIVRAAELLLSGDAAIDAIAGLLAFPDRFYFSRVFTRRIGCSPAAYRPGQRV